MSSSKMIQIVCPKCQKKYRVDENQIPRQGIVVQCKACGTKFQLLRVPKEPESVPDTCPDCGFTPIKGDRCYQCGLILRKMRPRPETHAGGSIEMPYCEIIIELKFNPVLFFLFFTKPNIMIDGESSIRQWGKTAFRLPAGKYNIEIEYLYMPGVKSGNSKLRLDIKKYQSAYLQYQVQTYSDLTHAIFKIMKIKDMPEIYFNTIDMKMMDESWYMQPTFIILMLIFVFPLGALLMSKSQQFSSNTKLILLITFGMIFISSLISIISGVSSVRM